ncbi:uncharacterized protein F5Z01DRAFT_328502 [Emericellopsis atlantica]|uniref:Hypervirulence associated protein TUDOR domain-containing protein n=1 Tax=Emericellopsis atlantica TaxID=2614577 RepID=A0A9P7ZFI3_9HYPO|nr:uncharacterized protein F5Z01DRAFT_328502 [Emericellopsis atlantica]KAG9250991.1 hypothetical protein F5Z01DRAFT_328502 [Emericellopsis atlantica]
MKDSETVVKEFNEIVNMTASELEKWLKSDDSRSAGWPKDEGENDGESVGHDSGRKIVEILKSNPDKKEDKYTDEQIQHMRKVVSYCKRHLAQEEKSNDQKSAEEVKKTKSYASLKNWGHDPLKKRGEADTSSKEDEKEEADEEEEAAADDGDDQEEDAEKENDQEEKQAGDKRKKSAGAQSGANKKRETRQSKAPNGSKKDENDNDENEDAEDDDYNEEEGKDDGDDGKDESSGKKPKKGPKPGDTVSWNWGNGNPEGKVLDVKAEKTSITTKRGNEVTRDGDAEDPAVVLDTGKSKAIKSNHELN